MLARQQVQQLNEELAATNEELLATNEELLDNNAELARTQQAMLASAWQLTQEREAFQQVFAQTPALAALLHGPDFTFTFVNPSFQRFFPNRPLVGHRYADVLPEAYAQGYRTWLQQVYTTGETLVVSETPLVYHDADGQEREAYFDLTCESYGHEAEGLFIFALEVTERVLARRQLATQQLLQAVFKQAPVALAILQGPDYRVEVANTHISVLWGRTLDQLIDQPLFEVLPEAVDQGFRDMLDGVRRTGLAFTAHERPTYLDRHGHRETLYFNFVYQPLRDEQGHVTSVTIVATDVTEQVLNRQQVQNLNEALQATNRELGTANSQLVRTNVDLDNFIYTASHDLKAPISNIEGLLLVLVQYLPGASRADPLVEPVLARMQDAVERFKRTIDHLTDVSKLQREHTPTREQVSLAAVVEDVRLDLWPLLTETAARLDVEVSACPVIAFSEKNLRSVVYNLLSNALKYRDPDRPLHIRLSCRSEAKRLLLHVQDNGLGLDASQQTKLFGMFQRLHTHVEGSGIGLYMVKKIMENAGGTIAVQSEPGVGSTFTVSFPV